MAVAEERTTARQQVEDTIKALGMGSFQACQIFLAFGIWLSDGIELAFATMQTKVISAEFGIPGSYRALVMSLVFLGMGVGCAVSGYVADNFGRRITIIWAYAGMAVMGVASAFVADFLSLATMRFVLGITLGLGMPASLALVNEFSPPAWHLFLQGLRSVVLTIGYLIAVCLAIMQDPSLAKLHWRQMTLLGALPAFFLGLAAARWLYDSPAFLAQRASIKEAMAVLTEMRRQNGRPEVSIVLGGKGGVAAPPAPIKAKPNWHTQLSVVFGQRLRLVTVALCFCAVTLNAVDHGIAYAEPIVLVKTHANMSAGMQVLFKYSVALPLRAIVVSPAIFLPHKVSLYLAMIINIIGCVLFAQTGAIGERSVFCTALYYASQYMPVAGCALGVLTVLTVAVDVYPTIAAATGVAVCLASGRLGSILAPLIFEQLHGSWQRFFYLLAALCGISMALFAACPDFEATRQLAAADSEAKEKERSPLCPQPSLTPPQTV